MKSDPSTSDGALDSATLAAIQNQLTRILATRAGPASIAHIISVTFFFGLALSQNDIDFEIAACVVLIYAASAARFLTAKKIAKALSSMHDHSAPESSFSTWTKNTFFAATLLQGASWAALMTDLVVHHGLSSLVTLMGLLVGASIAAGSTTSLGPSPKLVKAFLFIIVGSVASALIIEGSKDSLWLGSNLAIFLWFNLKQASAQYTTIFASERWRIQAQQANQELRAIFNTVPAQITVTNDELSYLDANEFAKSQFFSEADIVNRAVGSVERSPDFAAFLQDLKAVSSPTAGNVISRQISLADPSGHPSFWILHGAKFQSRENIKLVVTASDVTTLKSAQLELLKAQQRTSELEKLVSIGQLASGLAHEINNPLTIISGNLAILKKTTPNESDRLSKLIVQSNRIAGVVRGFTKFGKMDITDKIEVADVFSHALNGISEVSSELQHFKCKLFRRQEWPKIAAKIHIESFEAAISAIAVHIASEHGRRGNQIFVDIDSQKTEKEDDTPPFNTQIVFRIFTESQLQVQNRDLWIELDSVSADSTETGKTGFHWLGMSIIKNILSRHGGALIVDANEENMFVRIDFPALLTQDQTQGKSAA